MWWAIFKYVGMVFFATACAAIFSTNVNAWTPDRPPEYKTSNYTVYQSWPCPESFRAITVSGEGAINACVMGDKTKVASYVSAQGSWAYAVSFPFENVFYRLDICTGVRGCVYSDGTDTLASPAGVYKNLVSNLKKTIQNGVIHYWYSEQASVFSPTRIGNLSMVGGSVAISNNGMWVLLEVKSYGIFRINVQTLEMRRVVAPGTSYGYGYDPTAELAISNNGSTIIAVGLNMGLQVVMVDETCGDRPTEYMETRYVGAVTGCRQLQTPTNNYIMAFAHAFRPKFSNDNASLSFDAYSRLASPVHVTLFSDSRPDDLFYVAIGDSFTSGEGEVDDSFYIRGAANRCHVSTRSYPYLLAVAWNVPGHSAACSGATVASARGEGLSTNQTDQLTELESHPSKIVTVGIGGNDAGLIGKLKTCLGLDTCEWAKTPEARQGTALEIKNLYPRLKDFYEDVKTRTAGPVVVVGYPRIISSQPQCASPIGILLNRDERVFMNEAIRYLNQVTRAAAKSVGIEYVDVEEALSGGELCTSLAPPFMNTIRIGDDFPDIAALPFVKIIGAESFHPTPGGHGRVAARILQDYPRVDTIAYCSSCSEQVPAPEPSSYWSGSQSTLKVQQAAPFLKKVTIKKGDSFEISFPAFSFQPSSDVVLELHSAVRSLGNVQAREDGSVSTIISVADIETGYHTVHAIGKSYAGSDIDTYGFLAVEDVTVFKQPADLAPNVSSTTKPSHHVVVNTPVRKNETRAESVLGESIVALSNNSPVSVDKKPTTDLPIKQGGGPVLYWVTVLCTATLLMLIGVATYSYYRQKHPGN